MEQDAKRLSREDNKREIELVDATTMDAVQMLLVCGKKRNVYKTAYKCK